MHARVSRRWIAFSFFVILGMCGVASLYSTLPSRAGIVFYPAFAIGAAFGGYVCARLSPGRSVIECGVGATAGAIIAVIANLSFDDLELVAGAEARTLAWALGASLVTFVGATIGALAGERREHQPRELLWLVAIAMGIVGFAFATILVLFVVHQLFGALAMGVVELAALLVNPFAVALLAQLASPEPIRDRALFLAPFVGGAALVGWAIAISAPPVALIIAMLACGTLAGWCCMLGAALARRIPIRHPAEIAPAIARSAD